MRGLERRADDALRLGRQHARSDASRAEGQMHRVSAVAHTDRVLGTDELGEVRFEISQLLTKHDIPSGEGSINRLQDLPLHLLIMDGVIDVSNPLAHLYFPLLSVYRALVKFLASSGKALTGCQLQQTLDHRFTR